MSPLVPYTEKGANFNFFQPEPEPPKPHLLYSTGTEIRLHVEGKPNEYVLAHRPAMVTALAIHGNRLVHAEHVIDSAHQMHLGRIFHTETGEMIDERPDWIGGLRMARGSDGFSAPKPESRWPNGTAGSAPSRFTTAAS
jgi:hypothetical protein